MIFSGNRLAKINKNDTDLLAKIVSQRSQNNGERDGDNASGSGAAEMRRTGRHAEFGLLPGVFERILERRNVRPGVRHELRFRGNG